MKPVAHKSRWPGRHSTNGPGREPDATPPGSRPGSKADAKDDLKSLPLAEVEKRLGSSPDGLTQVEAEKRLAQYGPNEIEEKKANPLLKFLTYFWGPIPWMIEAAVILSGVLRHWPDFFIILVLLLANAGVGFWEERQAGKAIDALKAELAIKARVRRDGKWITPPSRELVPGDVIRLRLGDIVPADARLLEGDPVEVDQSALTGESLPATRQTGEAVFSASIIRQGEIGALVYATGANTYFGKTAELVQEAQTVSHFQRAVLKIGTFLIILAVALVAVIIVVSIIRGDPFFTTLQFALVLTVAAIPVAMPTVLSVTMAVGARLLATKKAIVSRLVAIEELAGVDVLCTDKTGTLTQNKLTLGDPFAVGEVTAEQVILDAALASRADDADAIDLAVLGGLTDEQGAAGLSGGPLPAVRRGAQMHRGDRHSRGRNLVQGDQGRAAGDPGAVRQRRAGEGRRRHGGQRVRGPGLPFVGRGPGRGRTGHGSSSACCPCSTRHAKTPRRPSPPRARWAWTSRWSPAMPWPSPRRPPRHWGWAPTFSMPPAWATSSAKRQPRRPSPSRTPTASPRCSPNTSSTSSTSCKSGATSSA